MTSMPIPVKSLDMSSATARVAPDLLKALAILSETTTGRSAVYREDLKQYWKSEKRPHFSFIESPIKMMKNVFYFILKALLVFKIFTFLF